MTTPILELAELTEAELLAFEKLNDSFWALDAIVQLTVLDKDLLTPPEDAAQGDRYIVPTGATGEWANKAPRIAYKTLEGWRFRTPRNGWLAVVQDENNSLYIYADIAWEPFSGSGSAGGSNDYASSTPDNPYDLDFSSAAAHEITLHEDVVLRPSNATAGKVSKVELITRQDDVGGFIVTFPAGTYWPGGTEPPVSRAARTVHRYEIETFDGGITLYARLLGGSFYNANGTPAPYPTSDDPYWPYVSYLLHMDGNDAESIFTDERGHAVTVVSSTHIPTTTTADKKFGTAAAKFYSPSLPPFVDYNDPTVVNYLTFAPAPENDLTVQDFTIECWIRNPGGVSDSFNTHTVWMKPGLNSGSAGMFAYISLGHLALAYISPIPGQSHLFSTYNAPADALITDSEFRHVFIARRAGVFYVGVNGFVWSDGVVRSSDVDLSTQPLNIGGGYMPGGYAGDYFYADLEIDEFRLTLGQARYAPEIPVALSESHYFGTYIVPAIRFEAPTVTYTPDVARRTRKVGATWTTMSTAELDTPASDVVVHIANKAIIRGATVLTQGGPGFMEIDIRKDALANWPSGSANSICLGGSPSTKPSITGGYYYRNTDVSGMWLTYLDREDVLTFHLESTSEFSEITITLDIEEVQ